MSRCRRGARRPETRQREANATLAWTSPVFGSNTSPKRPDLPAIGLPLMKCPISRMGTPPCGCLSAGIPAPAIADANHDMPLSLAR